jgi:putative N6-adenine-specific DNA methylase
MVSNPPWGVRIGEPRALRDLYARLGQVLEHRFPGWPATLLLPEAPLERDTGLGWETLARTSHGGVAVRMVRWPRAQAGHPSRGSVDAGKGPS